MLTKPQKETVLYFAFLRVDILFKMSSLNKFSGVIFNLSPVLFPVTHVYFSCARFLSTLMMYTCLFCSVLLISYSLALLSFYV